MGGNTLAVRVQVLPMSAETLLGIFPSMLSPRPNAIRWPSFNCVTPAWIPAMVPPASWNVLPPSRLTWMAVPPAPPVTASAGSTI